jgi:hypothetical protein
MDHNEPKNIVRGRVPEKEAGERKPTQSAPSRKDTLKTTPKHTRTRHPELYKRMVFPFKQELVWHETNFY